MLSHLPPFFLSSFFLLLAVLAPKLYRQKYVLQTRNSQGNFVALAKCDHPISIGDVRGEFGEGRYYILRSTKPWYRTVWKVEGQQCETTKEESQHGKVSSTALLKIEKKARYLAYGTVATA